MPRYQVYIWITDPIPVTVEADSVEEVAGLLDADGLGAIRDCPFNFEVPVDWTFYPHDIHPVEEAPASPLLVAERP
jgi:hypothetical protein